MKISEFREKAIKLLFCQCKNILPFAFSALTSSRSVNKEKAADKSIVLSDQMSSNCETVQ